MVSYVDIGLENCEILYRCEMLLLICITYGKSAVLVALKYHYPVDFNGDRSSRALLHVQLSSVSSQIQDLV